ncbi:MAG: class I SAM-dependent methyltransferase [Candidatus Peribacteraceae bacterium]|jgi:SAM-dependent methyltransferase|nr:class I SAM-dependent methyltransferase [Candidatus Peribacteraceae bacterium]
MQLPQFQVHVDLEERHWWFLGRRAIVRTLLKRVVPPSRERLILDVGCGTGGNTAAFASQYTCVGIDPSSDAIAFARQRFPGIEFRQGFAPQDCRDLLRQADVVFFLDVLEHVREDFALVSQLLAGMKSGAYLFMTAPGDPDLWGPHDRGFEHERRYNLSRFRMLWEGLPVEECVCSALNARLYPIAKLSRLFSRFRGKALGPGQTDLSLPSAPVNALLYRIFAGEVKRILRAWQGGRPYRHGVSVFAVLKRGAQEVIPRTRPADLPLDPRPWMLD